MLHNLTLQERREEGKMLEERLCLQPRADNRGRETAGETGGMGYEGTESREGKRWRRLMESEEESGTQENWRVRGGEGQVVINVLLFTAGCLQEGCVCMHVGALALGHL